MDVALNQNLFRPANLQELFNDWDRCPDAVPFAGGTQILRFQGNRVAEFPRNILSLERLEELHRVTRTERYLEIGAMVTLNEIIQLGKIVPEVFTRCLEGIGGSQIRNLATIGGNLCNGSRRLDASAPMIALDAHYELRTAASARWIAASQFSAFPGPLPLNPKELFTRIRIPLEQWDYSLYKKFKPLPSEEEGSGMVFIIRNQNNVLTNLRIVFVGDLVLEDTNAKTLLIGKRLPLDRKDARRFIEQWEASVTTLPQLGDFLQAHIINFIETSVLSLSD
jgi:CO/xanthine dehydrogenase FAD-binding subunit